MNTDLFATLTALPHVEFAELLAAVKQARGLPPDATPTGRYCVRLPVSFTDTQRALAVLALQHVDGVTDERAEHCVRTDYLSDWLAYDEAQTRCEKLNAAVKKYGAKGPFQVEKDS